MADSLFSTNPVSSAPASDEHEAQVSSAVASEVAKSTAPSSADSTVTDSSAAAAASHADYLASLAEQTTEERTEVETIDSKTKNVIVTEKNGHVVKAQLQAPSYEVAEDIDSAHSFVKPEDGGVVIPTPVRFQRRLFKIVKQLTIDDHPAGTFGFGLADNGHVEAFRVVVDKADSFLTSILNAD